MRSYAEFKRNELLQTYTAFRSVLETIICDCGDDSSTGCFADHHLVTALLLRPTRTTDE